MLLYEAASLELFYGFDEARQNSMFKRLKEIEDEFKPDNNKKKAILNKTAVRIFSDPNFDEDQNEEEFSMYKMRG